MKSIQTMFPSTVCVCACLLMFSMLMVAGCNPKTQKNDPDSLVLDVGADGGDVANSDTVDDPEDVGVADSGDDTGVDTETDTSVEEDTETVCADVNAGMTIRQDTTLCGETYELSVAPGDAAVSIGADGVTVRCKGTVLKSAAGMGKTKNPTVGFRIDGHSDVTLEGCAAHGFRYGLAAKDASNITVTGANFDENFHDPSLGWVQDSVQGGGIRLENVDGGKVAKSSFRKNWNGIELRGTKDVEVVDNTADHTSNTGATLVRSHKNRLENNDFSWAIRGKNLSFPSNWYKVDTKDSAGIILDAGSSENEVIGNDTTYGGDGIFIRAVIGACATDNLVEKNDTSFSPHNAIECWCDGNEFVGNKANESQYGVWLGGTDRGVVKDNTVKDNNVDGISIQIGENRHTRIVGNEIAGNGRVGVLITGREIQSWHSLNHWSAGKLANSAQILVQRNDFANNQKGDVFTTSTRSMLLASNCKKGGTVVKRFERESEFTGQIGSCSADKGASPPKAKLKVPSPVKVGKAVALDASGSTAQSGNPLTFRWLVQSGSPKFPSGSMPKVLAGGTGMDKKSVTFAEPGIFDASLTVDDGTLGAMDWSRIAVIPDTKLYGEKAADWDYGCATGERVDPTGHGNCTTTIKGLSKGVAGKAVHVQTDAPFDFRVLFPKSKNLGADASTKTRLGFFVRAENPNMNGWQGKFPVVTLGSGSGTIEYRPQSKVLPKSSPSWQFVSFPLAGGEGWKRVDNGGSLSKVDWVAFDVDTYGWSAYDLYFDAVTFY